MPTKRDSSKRDYVKESAWSKEKYDRIGIRLEKGVLDELKKKTSKNGITISEFLRDCIDRYLGKKKE